MAHCNSLNIAGPIAPGSSAPAKSAMGRRFLLSAAGVGLIAGGGVTLGMAQFGSTTPSTPPQAAPISAAPASPAMPDMPHVIANARDWAAFRANCIAPDGRVVDSANGGESHTESQGLGMLFAAAFDDRATFDLVWGWTASHLSRPSDALFAWRYQPGAATPVADMNNATDGDILIAAALMRASSRWNEPKYAASGRAIARDILSLLVQTVGGRTVLLPAAYGFTSADHVVVNPSYYIFPLISDLTAAYPSPIWARLLADGHSLIDEARFGEWALPSDWLRVATSDGALSMDADHPARFSYDAVRIPLFIAWAGGKQAALARFNGFWGHRPSQAPAWVDLKSDICAPYRACAGVVAIAALAQNESRGGPRMVLPAISKADGYYSAALILLSRIATHEAAVS